MKAWFVLHVLCLVTVLASVRTQSEESGQYVTLFTRERPTNPFIPSPVNDIFDRLDESGYKFREFAQLVQEREILKQQLQDAFGQLGQDGASNRTADPLCANQTGEVLGAVLERKQWALQMLDAAGKPGSGLIQLQLTFLGTFTECMDVKAVDTVFNISSNKFNGKYCLASLPLQQGPAPQAPGGPNTGFGAKVGLCFPDTCNGEDVTIILNNLLDLLLEQLNASSSFPFRFGPTSCQERDNPLDTKAIAVFVVGVLFALIMVIGTVYDLVTIQLPQWYSKQFSLETKINGGNSFSKKIDEASPLLEAENKSSIDYSQSEPSVCGKILLSFSMYTNAAKLLSTKSVSGTLTAVHGMRFLSLTWVILGHTFVFGLGAIENVVTFLPEVIKRFTFQAILNATVSVDSFFTLSGLLVGYLSLKEMKQSGGKINWFMFYFHRYWRLTPPYMFLLMLYVPLFPYISSGPLWNQKGFETDYCQDTWWTNLLYVNNLVYKDKMCMAWSWYLANDMQFYILSPLIFVPLFHSWVFGFISVIVFLLATMISAGVISRVENLPASFAAVEGGDPNAIGNYFFDYYIVPWCRMGPYIVGIVTGYLLYKTDCRMRLNKWLVLLGWCVASASALAVLYGLYDTTQGHPLTSDVAAFYNAVNRSVWGACLCWVVFACANGYGGFVNTLLSWKAFIPLSRLTYCAYLVHPIVMFYWFNSQQAMLYISDSNIVIWFLGLLVPSYCLAFLLSLAFESPMMALEKAFLKRDKRS